MKRRRSRHMSGVGVRGMKKRRRWRKPNQYEIRISNHSASGDYREGPGYQGKPEHAGLPGGAEGDQDGNQGSSADDFQSESAFSAYGDVSGKRAAARKVRRLPSGLEEGVRAVAVRREDAGIRAEFVRVTARRSSRFLNPRFARVRNDKVLELTAQS